MNIRRFRVLHQAGATYAEIARECGCDWRTVRKYLTADALVGPPKAPPRAGTQPALITPFVSVVEGWLRADIGLKASVIHERLVAQYGFTGHYQRVKMFVATARPRISAELDADDENRLTGLHRRFETQPGVQAQVDWGDEGDLLAHVGIGHVYSFHMVLAHSRDPFCLFTTSTDLATFWEAHRAAFDHFGGVPAQIVYDRTKTVIKRHVAPRAPVPLHPEAAAFADHYGFDIDVLAAYRPTGKGKIERQVDIVRDHVVAGRRFDSLAELQTAFTDWLAIRRAQVHRTHGEVIAVRAEADRAALAPIPPHPYLVCESHLRRVGKDALVSFEASFYSVPAARIRPGQRVAVRAGADTLTIHTLTPDPDGTTLLTTHTRATRRGQWVIDPAHWDGLPDGHTRATVIELPTRPAAASVDGAGTGPLAAVVAHHRADVAVARRDLAAYQALAAGRGRA
ncbi:IS21 family transposase [Raineyella fluvialis]|uniref:IS21 family transposase n=1 Tax=Raineyella fluvialis TaxID=2662261 RepID=A0A5Q2F7G4_9ACTN|nr:IS21 family transposase [Raineyella fluvialis]QGF22343.1 IS21 family transposase [Raineyella fluvialis]QGF22598.1 IS21 family transposase [Raineyella fluvialis]QGF23600.1 IS21 family transposase [Raineyella fluvialis]